MAIDIAVDLKGHTVGQRLGIFAHRAAPIQAHYLGYPGTIGAPYIDYLIADETVIPPSHDAYYREKVLRLPNCYQVNDRSRTVSDRTPTRAELGLPENGFVFCSFNNSYKIHPQVFGIWMRLLTQVPGSVLWLLDDNALATANLRKEAAARGVDPARLVFAPRVPVADHLARQKLADLFLDTRPYNAHTTASDALWVGLPVLTQPGETFAGRVAASILIAMGLPELIVANAAEYEATALALATDPERLRALKERLATCRETAPLFDIEAFAGNIEAAYLEMVDAYYGASI
jgi:protein O-GlcNAc transferase